MSGMRLDIRMDIGKEMEKDGKAFRAREVQEADKDSKSPKHLQQKVAS